MPTMTDGRGIRVTASSAAEVASVDCFTSRLLRINRGTESILEDARTFPDTPMIQLLAAAYCLFGQTGPADQAAAGFLVQAAPLIAMATPREQMIDRALRAWAAKDHLTAVTVLEETTRQFPTDMLAAKLAEFFYYVLGQEHEGPRFLAHMDRLAAANDSDPDFLAMHSFAQELCGQTTAARNTVERALALEPNNPWAHHTVAHIHLRAGDTQAGISALESFLPVWIGAARFIHCHNTWHLALAHLEDGNLERALHLYRRHVGGITPDLVPEQIDAIAFLWRLEMAGRRMDEEWAALADKAEGLIGTRYMPFIDAHAAYALARAGRSDALARLVGLVRNRAARGDAEAKRSWAPVGVALVEASAASAQGDAARCAALMEPIMPGVTVVGGSDAQVDLFRLCWFHALVMVGRKADARAFWQSVAGSHPATPADRHRLGLAA